MMMFIMGEKGGKRRNAGMLGAAASVVLVVVEGEAGFDCKSRHVRGGEWVFPFGGGKHEIYLIGLELVFHF